MINWSYAKNPKRSITIYITNTRKVINENNPNFEEILNKLKAYDVGEDVTEEEIANLCDKELRFNNYGAGKILVNDGEVFINGDKLPDELGDLIISHQEENIPVENFIAFWNRLQKNPSYNSRNQLFKYLQANDIPLVKNGEIVNFDGVQIDCSGFFVSWKSVREDFLDHHTGTFDNSPGKIVSMPREQVDDNPNNTCSSGLHVAAWEYAENFGSSPVYVKVYVDPADVVSVPVDYNSKKMRVCKYYVIESTTKERALVEKSELLSASSFVRSTIDDEDEDEDEDDYDYSDEFY